jgi:hypothetical protein
VSGIACLNKQFVISTLWNFCVEVLIIKQSTTTRSMVLLKRLPLSHVRIASVANRYFLLGQEDSFEDCKNKKLFQIELQE